MSVNEVRVTCPTPACDHGRIKWIDFKPKGGVRVRYTKCKTCRGSGYITKREVQA